MVGNSKILSLFKNVSSDLPERLNMFSVFCLTPTDPRPRVQGEKIRLDDVLNGKFKPNPFNATWQKGR